MYLHSYHGRSSFNALSSSTMSFAKGVLGSTSTASHFFADIVFESYGCITAVDQPVVNLVGLQLNLVFES